MDSAPEMRSGGCPRCGVRLRGDYKYCPNCAYRVRPSLLEPRAPQPRVATSMGARLLSVGGFLAFASLLLLVFFTGIRLFVEQPATNAGPVERIIRPSRDRNTLPLARANFVSFEKGIGVWGLYGRAAPDGEAQIPNPFFVDDRFELGTHEITNDQYYSFLLAWAERTRRPLPEDLYPDYWSRPTGQAVDRIYDAGHGDHPVTSIGIDAAHAFAAWFWETHCDADEDLVADLPTAQEFVYAARGDDIELHFPWGAGFEGSPAVVLRGTARPVRDSAVGRYRGLWGMVGNVAEWVYDTGTPAAAGWSFLDSDVEEDWRFLQRRTPFSDAGMEQIEDGRGAPHVGFRLVLRPAPRLPEFTDVRKGRVRHGPPPPKILPPELRDPDEVPLEHPEPLDPDEIVTLREPPVTFETDRAEVRIDFEIARAEISNRQFLAFLVAQSGIRTPDELEELRPDGFFHENRIPQDSPFRGVFGDPARLRNVFPAGAANRPVQGVTVSQAQEYARWLTNHQPGGRRLCRLPSVTEFLRAGRGEGIAPYPWGRSATNPGLICAGRADSEGRAVSLLGRLGPGAPPIVGLAGNLLEWVRDERGGRMLRAGGCYEFQAVTCTLDCFLAADWEQVLAIVRAKEGEESRTFAPASLTGFRVVRVAEMP